MSQNAQDLDRKVFTSRVGVETFVAPVGPLNTPEINDELKDALAERIAMGEFGVIVDLADVPQLNSKAISTPGLVERASSGLPALAAQVDSGAMTYEDAAKVVVRAALQRDPRGGELQAILDARSSAGTTLEALQDVAAGIGASAQFLFRK